MKPFYTPKELIQLLGFSKNTVYKYLEEGKIKSTRIGKGSFRIPEGEVRRLLQIKRGGVVEVTGTEVGVESGTDDQGKLTLPVKEKLGVWWGEHIGQEAPNLFDWFVGLLTVLVGFALFLFPGYFYQARFETVLPWFLLARYLLLFGGGLLIILDLAGEGHKSVHIGMHIFMAMGLVSLAGLYWLGQEMRGVILYGSIGIVMLVTAIIRHVPQVIRFIVAAWLVAGSGAVMAWISPGYLKPLLFATLPAWISPGLTFVVASAILGVSLVSYSLKNWWYTPVSFISGAIFLGFGLLSLTIEAWDRAVAYVIFGAFSFVFPFWSQVSAIRLKKSGKSLLAFVYVGTVLALGLVLVNVVREESRAVALARLKDRAQIVALQVEEFLAEAEQDVVALSQNSSLRQAMTKDDLEQVKVEFRDALKTGDTLRRFILLDASGTVVQLYPEGEPDIRGVDLSFRGYVRMAKEGKVVVSDLLEAVVSTASRDWAVAVAAPIYDIEGELNGILVGGLDVEEMQDSFTSDQLSGGAYLAVTDAERKVVVHPDESKRWQILAWSSELDGVNENGVRTLGVGKSAEGNTVLAAVARVNKYQWMVRVAQPVGEATATGMLISLLIFLVMFGGAVVWLVVATVGTEKFKLMRALAVKPYVGKIRKK